MKHESIAKIDPKMASVFNYSIFSWSNIYNCFHYLGLGTTLTMQDIPSCVSSFKELKNVRWRNTLIARLIIRTIIRQGE